MASCMRWNSYRANATSAEPYTYGVESMMKLHSERPSDLALGLVGKSPPSEDPAMPVARDIQGVVPAWLEDDHGGAAGANIIL